MNANSMTWNSAVCSTQRLTQIISNGLLIVGTLLLLTWWQPVRAEAPPLNALQEINFAGLPGNQVQITFKLSHPATSPASFTIDNPARIAFDLPATKSELANRSQAIGVGPAKSVTAVEVKGRTRVVLNLVEMVPYETRTDGNQITIVLGASTGSMAGAAPAASTAATGSAGTAQAAVSEVDFRRGDQGEGRVVVTLSDPAIPVDMRQESGKVILDFKGAGLPAELERRLDVTDFATPVKTIDTARARDGVRMAIAALGEYEHLAYQAGNQFTVEIRKTTKEEQEQRKKEEFGFTGERLSLNFQNIEVRSVLQLLADFTGTNVVVSDTVKGSLTLRMQNVPWDQALDIVLKTKGLAKRQNGNVVLIAPSEEIAAREKLELESMKQIEELAPLYSDYIQVNYAKAGDLAALLKTSSSSLMSERGEVSVDARTNTLLVQDTADKLEQIRRMVARLDIPVRQVLIESRIVLANNDFAKDLGVRFGLSHSSTDGDKFIDVSGTQFGTVPGSGGEPLLVNLPVIGSTGSIGMALGKLGSNVLQLELSAMQMEDRGEIISSPRVITSDQQEASIKQGVEIPYQESTSSGAASVSFKEAVLELTVTPQITPDDRIIMDLYVSKDNVGVLYEGIPSIDTQNVTTRVLVDNGETLVLGGIYEQQSGKEVESVPFFGQLPALGWLFRTERNLNEKSELLIFVTPKILKQGMSIE